MATSVFVRGFDFGTSEDDIMGHCAGAGTVVGVEMWGKGAAVVTYSSKGEAAAAVKSLNGTTIGANTRYIDVKLNDTTKGNKKEGGGVKREFVKDGEGCRVFVRGFDFGTTDEQFEGHMSAAGNIQRVGWVTKGSAVVVYSSPEEAQNAVEQLQGTTMPGNSRYIDVILKEGDDTGFPAAKRAKTASSGGGKGGAKGGGKGKGGGAWVWIPEATTIPALTGGRSKGAGKSGGKGAKGQQDPPGSGRVFVRGFDFGTTDAQFEGHMKKAGPIHCVHWVTKGSAVVVYKSKAGAAKACNNLNGTTLPGNTRYMDVILKDSE